MKNLFTALIVTIITLGAFSQEEKKTDDFQSAFGAQKDQLIEDVITLGEDESKVFDKIYQEYETKRKELGLVRVKIFKEFTEDFTKLSEDEMDSLIKQIFDLDEKNSLLLKTYYAKVKEEINTTAASQFYQVEMFSLTNIKYAIYQTVPFVGSQD